MQGGEDTERHVSRREMSIPAHICRTPLHSQGYKRGGYYGNGCKSSTKKGEGWMDVKEGTAHDAFKLSKRKPRQFHPREKVSNPAAGRGWGRAGPEPSPQRPGRDLLSCPSDHPGCSARHAHGALCWCGLRERPWRDRVIFLCHGFITHLPPREK